MRGVMLGVLAGLCAGLALTAVAEAAAALLGVSATVAAGCSLPIDETAQPIDPDDLPEVMRIGFGGLAGIPSWRAASMLPRPISGALIALALWALAVAALAVSQPGLDGRAILFALLGCLAYATTFVYLYAELTSESHGVGTVRRAFLLRFAGWGVLAFAGAVGLRFLFDSGESQQRESPALPPSDGLATEVTPNNLFYVVSKNEIDPTVDANDWRLEVTGLVDNPMTLTSRAHCRSRST